tara:strand:+ start:4419 stop:4973 length:555 start_codon:yes stop_codon:yes gene_type:complete
MSNANKLADILSRSRAVMQKAEENHGTTSNNTIPTPTYSEKEVPNLTENFINKHSKGTTRSVAPQGGQYRNLKTSKMPKEILDAMVNNPIEIPESPNHTFELSDVEDLVNESVPTQQPLPTPTPNYETNDIRQIVREEIGDVVREVVEEYLDKSLVTEDIKIKIGDTVFGGKLKPIPTKKKKRV